MDKTIDIAKMRLAAGLTQAQLALQAGCTQATIARIEKGANAKKPLMAQILYVLRHESKENERTMIDVAERLEKKPCSECKKKDVEISDLKRQLNLLIETNAMLAAKPSSVGHACGATSGDIRHKEKTA